MPKKTVYPDEYPWNLLLAIKGRSRRSLPSPSSAYKSDGLSYVLSLLSESDQQLLRLLYQEGLTPSEAASALGIPPKEFPEMHKRVLEKLRSDFRWGLIRWGIAGYLRKRIADEYRSGYHAGFCTGYRQAMAEPPVPASDEILDLPLETLGLIRRSFNCLDRYGCRSIRDVAALEEKQIRLIRNLGTVSALEIAGKLHEHGIFHTAWDIFLQK